MRGRDYHCQLAVTLCFHRDSLLFNVSCLKPCDGYRIKLYTGLSCTFSGFSLGGMLH